MPSTAHDAQTAHVPGEMPIKEHVRTFHSVMGLFRWGSLGVAAALILLTLWFCTPAGLFTGAIVAVVVLALGVFFLREKKPQTHP